MLRVLILLLYIMYTIFIIPRAIAQEGYVIASVCLSTCLSAVLTFATRTVDLEPSLYDPTPETIMAKRHLVLSVDLDSMDIGMVCREIAIFLGISWGLPFCLCTLTIRTVS